MKTGDPGSFFTLFRNGVGYLFIPAALVWCFFFWRVRFEENSAAIYYCPFFPVRIYYAEITRLTFFYQKHKNQEVPVVIYFHLRSGRIKSWNINLFSLQTAPAIKSEFEKRIDFTEKRREITDIESWANEALRPPTSVKIFLIAAILTMAGFGMWEMAEQMRWDKQIKTWDKVDGVILKNTTKQVPDGKRTKTVPDVEYKYTYKGKTCYGTRIVYDSSMFPDLKVGQKRQVIVNPENPQECAIMFWYRGMWGMIRWVECTFFYLVSLGLGIALCCTLFQKKAIVPEKLKNYMASIPPERFYAALDIEKSAAALNNIELLGKMEYLQDGRFGVIRKKVSALTYILWGSVFLLAVTISIFIPLCWIMAVCIGFVIYTLYVPRMTVFDFQEKRFFCCKNFHPEKAEKEQSFSFSDVDHLCCRVSGRFIGVFAVTRDGSQVPLFNASRKHLDQLFETLPELAEKMGRLTITC